MVRWDKIARLDYAIYKFKYEDIQVKNKRMVRYINTTQSKICVYITRHGRWQNKQHYQR